MDKIEEIRGRLGCMCLLVDVKMEQEIYETLSHLPEEVIGYVVDNCWFVGGSSDIYDAFTIPGKHVANKYIVCLPAKISDKLDAEIQRIIIHEIGHCYLKHKSPSLDNLSKEERNKQEEEAEKFVNENWKR